MNSKWNFFFPWDFEEHPISESWIRGKFNTFCRPHFSFKVMSWQNRKSIQVFFIVWWNQISVSCYVRGYPKNPKAYKITGLYILKVSLFINELWFGSFKYYAITYGGGGSSQSITIDNNILREGGSKLIQYYNKGGFRIRRNYILFCTKLKTFLIIQI